MFGLRWWKEKLTKTNFNNVYFQFQRFHLMFPSSSKWSDQIPKISEVKALEWTIWLISLPRKFVKWLDSLGIKIAILSLEFNYILNQNFTKRKTLISLLNFFLFKIILKTFKFAFSFNKTVCTWKFTTNIFAIKCIDEQVVIIYTIKL